jgi:flagellar biosynthesis chaperone FliJ
MALERLLRLRRRLRDAAHADAARCNGVVQAREQQVAACASLARTAGAQADLGVAELLAQASVHALEARRIARAQADLATAAATLAHREMRQIEIASERDATARARRREAREQQQTDEHAARVRRVAR